MAMLYPAGTTRTWPESFPAELGVMYSRPTLPALPGFSTPIHRERYYDNVNLMVPLARAPVMRLGALGEIAGLGEAVRCFGQNRVPAMNAARARGEQALSSVRAAIAAERAQPGSTPTGWLRGVLASFATAFEPGPGQWCRTTQETTDAEAQLLALLRDRPPPGVPAAGQPVPAVGQPVRTFRVAPLTLGLVAGLAVGLGATALYFWGKRSAKKGRTGNRRRRNGRAGLTESKKPVWQQIPSHLSRWRKTADGYIWHGRGRAQGLRIAIERMGGAEDERWGWTAYVTAPGVSSVFGPLTSPEAAANRARDFVLRRIS